MKIRMIALLCGYVIVGVECSAELASRKIKMAKANSNFDLPIF